jgi:molybdopterin converting factor small subunit
MKVNIRTSLAFNEIFGQWKFQVSLPDKSTFRDLVDTLYRDYGERLGPYVFEGGERSLSTQIMFMVNGRNIRFLNGEQTILENNDQITLLLPAGGG